MLWIKDFFRKLNLNINLLMIIVSLDILLILLDIGNLSNLVLKNNSCISLADCLIASSNNFIFALCYIPLQLFFIQNLMKYELDTNFVLRNSNKHNLWNKMCIKILLVSILFILLLSLFTCFIGSFYSVSCINWISKTSYYYSVILRINYSTQFHQVLIRFF